MATIGGTRAQNENAMRLVDVISPVPSQALRDAGTIARGAGDGLCRIVPVIGGERAHAQQRHGHDDEQQNSQDLASGIHLEIPPIKKCHEQSILFMTLETPGQ